MVGALDEAQEALEWGTIQQQNDADLEEALAAGGSLASIPPGTRLQRQNVPHPPHTPTNTPTGPPCAWSPGSSSGHAAFPVICVVAQEVLLSQQKRLQRKIAQLVEEKETTARQLSGARRRLHQYQGLEGEKKTLSNSNESIAAENASLRREHGSMLQHIECIVEEQADLKRGSRELQRKLSTELRRFEAEISKQTKASAQSERLLAQSQGRVRKLQGELAKVQSSTLSWQQRCEVAEQTLAEQEHLIQECNQLKEELQRMVSSAANKEGGR